MEPTDEYYIRYVVMSGACLIAHYRQDKDIKHIDESIALFDVASEGTEKEDPVYMTILATSANARIMRYDHLHDIADLNIVISILQTAIDVLPPQRQELVEWREKLGSAFRFRHEALDNMEDLREAASQYRQAAMFTPGTQRHRALCARLWALVTDQLGNTTESLEAYQLAVELGTLLTGLERSMDQRQVHLEEAQKVGLYIAAKALEKGEVERAVVWLEQGRGLLWRQLEHVRSPVNGLEARHPELARRVQEMSRRLEQGELLSVSPASEAKVGGDLHWTLSMPREVRTALWKDNESTARLDLILQWEKLLREVREMEGFETFLRPPPVQVTTGHLPQEGFTILLHAHQEGSYAIVIDRNQNANCEARLRSIPLRGFTYGKGEVMVRKLRARLEAVGLRGSGEGGIFEEGEDADRALRPFIRSREKGNDIASVLKDVWDLVVKPVVEYLKLEPSTTTANKARIWWCATGPLAFLPLHAAGTHAASNHAVLGTALVDYAISSYTPTLASLAKIVQIRSLSSSLNVNRRAGLLIISHSEVTGLPRLPGTLAEVAAIRGLLNEDPNGVKFDIVHFACHANQDRLDPLKSGFSLEDGQLTLADIIKRRDEHETILRNPVALAFLSACQTSTETESFSEEAVHLVAGMLAAGYQGVVGTLWGIPDRLAPAIAEESYRRMFSKEVPGVDAGYALHCATEKLREQLGSSEEAHLAWIPFVHFGV